MRQHCLFFLFFIEDHGFCELDSYLLLDKISLVTLPDMTSSVTSSTSTASGKDQLTSDVMTGSSKFNSMDIYLRKEDYMSGQPQLYRANCGKIIIYYNFVLKGHGGEICAPMIFS
jgi:hypothetical protein